MGEWKDVEEGGRGRGGGREGGRDRRRGCSVCIMYRATIFMYCRHAYSSSSISSEPTSHSMKPTPQHACLWGLRCMRYMVHTHKHLTHKHTHAYTRTHAYMHAHACTHTHTHTHNIHTHTRTHTHTQPHLAWLAPLAGVFRPD